MQNAPTIGLKSAFSGIFYVLCFSLKAHWPLKELYIIRILYHFTLRLKPWEGHEQRVI